MDGVHLNSAKEDVGVGLLFYSDICLALATAMTHALPGVVLTLTALCCNTQLRLNVSK